MAIRKPNLSVTEAKRLASIRSAATNQDADQEEEHGSSSDPQSAISTGKKAALRFSKVQVGDASAIVKVPPSQTNSAGIAPSPAKAQSRSSAPQGNASSGTGAASGPQSFNQHQTKVQVFLSATLPAPAVSPVFQMLCKQYTPQKALQMILRRALDDYEEMLENGSFQKAPSTYVQQEAGEPETFVQTSRMMPKPLVNIARAHFDPLGLESTRAFGQKLATAALAAFFSEERKNPF